MSTISSLKLQLLKHDHAKKTATVKVSYKLLLSLVERKMHGLRWKETIQLWGSDSPDADDYLYTYPISTFSTETDGSISRSRTVTIGDDILDEDGFFRPTDEVYAKVWATPLLPSKAYKKSNQIKHKF